ncbi:MAG: hypothetical protein ACRDD7_04765, partial [Peptostreptococcaceae bacterium]
YIIINKYDETKEIEAHKILNKYNLILWKFVLASIPIYNIYIGISMNNFTITITGILIATVFIYLGLNLAKMQFKVLDKKFDMENNKPNKFIFFDSYCVFEKNNLNSYQNGKLCYEDICKVYITNNLYILKSTNISLTMYKNGFTCGTSNEFTEFLKEKFKDKVIYI